MQNISSYRILIWWICAMLFVSFFELMNVQLNDFCHWILSYTDTLYNTVVESFVILPFFFFLLLMLCVILVMHLKYFLIQFLLELSWSNLSPFYNLILFFFLWVCVYVCIYHRWRKIPYFWFFKILPKSFIIVKSFWKYCW